MEILDQPLIVLTREKSRLANEYRSLKEAIIGQNIIDVDGAVYALTRMAGIYKAARATINSQSALKIIEKANDIARIHKGNGKIAILAADIFSEAGEYEQEELMLTEAVRVGFRVERALSLRAIARINLNRADEALKDLIAVLSSSKATSFEFRPAIQMLRAIAPDPDEEAKSLIRRPETRIRAKIMLAPILMQYRDNLELVASELQDSIPREELSPQLKSDVLNTICISRIGIGQFEKAIDIIAEDDDPLDDPSVFNTTMAKWGRDGYIDSVSLEDLSQRLASMELQEANAHQCSALIQALSGKAEVALWHLDRASERLITTGLVFSCWTYLYRTVEDFMLDLTEMREQIEAGKSLKPPFLDVQRRV